MNGPASYFQHGKNVPKNSADIEYMFYRTAIVDAVEVFFEADRNIEIHVVNVGGSFVCRKVQTFHCRKAQFREESAIVETPDVAPDRDGHVGHWNDFVEDDRVECGEPVQLSLIEKQLLPADLQKTSVERTLPRFFKQQAGSCARNSHSVSFPIHCL
jgi:hypothetical protein